MRLGGGGLHGGDGGSFLLKGEMGSIVQLNLLGVGYIPLQLFGEDNRGVVYIDIQIEAGMIDIVVFGPRVSLLFSVRLSRVFHVDIPPLSLSRARACVCLLSDDPATM